jgi:phosphate-selective porin
MIKTKNLFALCLIFACFSSLQSYAQANDSLKQSLNELQKAVETLKKIKITGWVQAQYQVAESKGAANFDGGAFGPYSDSRFMIRRGRVKFTYTQKLSQFVMQINGTERGFNLVEIYAKVTDPWTKSFSLTAGVMNRPFGFEIDQSSSVRESPERSRYTQILMPNERDLGAKITYEPLKQSKLYGLRLDAGFYNGQGIAVPGTTSTNNGVNEYDNVKDFIGRICYYKDSKDEKYRYGIGMSHYNGGIVNTTNQLYQLNGSSFAAADTTNQTFKGKSAKRIYTGVELFFSVKSVLGKTTLRGEYIFGTQPSLKSNSASLAALPTGLYASRAIYSREFNGSYAYLIHRIGKTKHELVAKYEWYDPNSKMEGTNIISANGFGAGDVKYTALGLGYNYYYDENVKFMFYYNTVTNEKTQIVGLTNDLKDNILTLRMQYRF